MEIEPKVTVIIPVYNVEKYIGKTIISLINQTFKDMEIILVNDDTPDDSIGVAEKILKKNKQKYLVINKENQGLGEARNTGLLNARGKYVYFLDSDDVILPSAMEKLVNIAEENKLDFVFSRYQMVKVNDEFKESNYKDTFELYSREKLQALFLKRKKIILASGTLFNKKWLNDNSLYFEGVRYSEDQLFIWKSLLYMDNAGYCNLCLYNYLVRPGSIMRSTPIEQIVNSYHFFVDMQNKYRDYEKVSRKTKKYLLSRWVLGALHAFAKSNGTDNQYKELYYQIHGRENLKRLLFFPNAKIRIIALLALLYGNKSYKIFKKI